MIARCVPLLAALAASLVVAIGVQAAEVRYCEVPRGARPHDVALDPKPSDRGGAMVRQVLGRAGEAWGAESGTDRLVVVKH